ncbi:hypothetical protein EYC84_002785 [Monilinia fructicola]|uniref:Uncharacterized protein n=1 Tax=Monilinia fructicola TaxID=38448 RepID=A0A5M9JRR9_MONFR|nr:hypothetical protein EYC84_002785 [Monilinia fructicola]
MDILSDRGTKFRLSTQPVILPLKKNKRKFETNLIKYQKSRDKVKVAICKYVVGRSVESLKVNVNRGSIKTFSKHDILTLNTDKENDL